MLKIIQNYIQKKHLPFPPSKLLVAVSGGADSVALLLILQELGYQVIAAHCNFHLRGEESNRDENFVKTLCENKQIELEVVQFDTQQYADEKGVSIEMAARQLRYDWFETQRVKHQAAAIAVAHHADDNAETLLLNLVRGTGIHGLKGMRPQNGYIIRPLLGVRRQELEAYLQKCQQNFVTDSTNLDTIYKRNKIRHEILPLLREMNPSIDTVLSETAQRLGEAEILYNEAVENWKTKVCEEIPDGIVIDLSALANSPAPSTLLHEILSPKQFTTAEISLMAENLERTTGTFFESPTHVAVLNRGKMEVRLRPVSIAPADLPEEGYRKLENGVEFFIEPQPRETLKEIPKCARQVAIDKKAVHGTLTVRSLKKGDRFQPYGMKGSKLVSDYLTDCHRSLIDKQKTLAVCDDQGILWLVGERIDQRAAVTDQTEEILLLTCRNTSRQK